MSHDADSGGGRRDRLVALGEISAEIAHELRNVLQTISSSAYVARIALGRGDTSTVEPNLARVERSARVAHGIVDGLMALAKGDTIVREEVFASDVLSEARADFAPAAAKWEDRVDPTGLRLVAHPGLLARLLRVLYENAIQASAPRAPTITTWVRMTSGRIAVAVADDGPGVPDALAARIFEPLVTARAGGTGLGLSLARRIAVAHTGTISLAPSSGAGATFWVDLPA